MRPTTASRYLAASASLILLSVGTLASAAEYNPARTRPDASEGPSVQRVIVKFRPASRLSTQDTTAREAAVTTDSSSRATAVASRTGLSIQGSRAISDSMQVMEVTPVAGNETFSEMLARLQADSEVEYAVPDRRVYAHATSNDPGAAGQWFLANAQASSINAQGAWDITRGHDGVVIAVVDTGVRFDHPDLRAYANAGKLLPGYDFVAADPGGGFRTANDGNGRDSDPSDPGDWVASSDNCGPVPTSDSSWHGTRVSGIIGAVTNNSTGIAGVNWNGYVLPIRALGKCGGFNSDVLAGIRWAAGLSVPGVPANPNPARVINVSLGSQGSCDAASANAIREVTEAGVLVVVSAGNEGGPVDSPANCPGAMAILGLRHAGTKVGFSSLGPQIALGAPGGNCVNTSPGSACLFSIDTTSNSGTTTPGSSIYTDQINSNVGTSFSSPIVSGIAGLMLAVNGNLRSEQLIQRMKNGAKKPFPSTSETTTAVCQMPTPGLVQSLECICTTAVCGAGMANAEGAVNEALRPIAAVLVPTSVSQGVSFTLNGGGSAAACGRTIANYSWSVVPGGTGSVTLTTNSGTTTSLMPPTSGSATVRLTITDDAGRTDSADVVVDTASASLVSPARATAGTTACLTPLPVAVAIEATDASAGEGGDSGTFTIMRGGDTSAALTVSLAISGTATSGADYQAIPTTVTIPAGSSSASVTVTPINDTDVESSETIIATLQAAAGYTVGTPSSATITLADNDTQTPAPPPADNGGGGGGGGSLDLFTLFCVFVFLARAAIQRRAVASSRS